MDESVNKYISYEYVVQSIVELDPAEVLNVYCFGSRLYGSHSVTSDYDYRVVCRDYKGIRFFNVPTTI